MTKDRDFPRLEKRMGINRRAQIREDRMSALMNIYTDGKRSRIDRRAALKEYKRLLAIKTAEEASDDDSR